MRVLVKSGTAARHLGQQVVFESWKVMLPRVNYENSGVVGS